MNISCDNWVIPRQTRLILNRIQVFVRQMRQTWKLPVMPGGRVGAGPCRIHGQVLPECAGTLHIGEGVLFTTRSSLHCFLMVLTGRVQISVEFRCVPFTVPAYC